MRGGILLLSYTLGQSKSIPPRKVWESKSIPSPQSKYLLYVPGKAFHPLFIHPQKAMFIVILLNIIEHLIIMQYITV